MYIYQLERSLINAQIKRFAKHVSGDVLDVGGGEHNRYKDLFTYTTFTCLDISPGPEVDIVASADAIPLPDACKDSIVSTQMLEHVKYPEKCVQEMYRVLKSGGHALITAPQWNELHSEPHDYWRYTKYGFVELFERNGFKVVTYEQRGGFFTTAGQMTMRYCMDRFKLHHRPVLGKVFSRIFQVMGAIVQFLDRHDTSVANRKHAIGWCFVFVKS
jgi:SAM-dependent methyltransferase